MKWKSYVQLLGLSSNAERLLFSFLPAGCNAEVMDGANIAILGSFGASHVLGIAEQQDRRILDPWWFWNHHISPGLLASAWKKLTSFSFKSLPLLILPHLHQSKSYLIQSYSDSLLELHQLLKQSSSLASLLQYHEAAFLLWVHSALRENSHFLVLVISESVEPVPLLCSLSPMATVSHSWLS